MYGNVKVIYFKTFKCKSNRVVGVIHLKLDMWPFGYRIRSDIYLIY